MDNLNSANVANEPTIVRKDPKLNRQQKRLIFYCIMIALPLLQFCICYIYVNFNSVLMAFKLYEDDYFLAPQVFSFANFEKAFALFFSATGWEYIKNSLILYAINLVIVLGLALVFSYYIAKNYLFSKFFRTVMYLPHVVSGVVFAMLYKYITIDVYAELWGEAAVAGGLLENETTQFATVLFFNIWLGFGQNVMLFTGSMSGIDGSIIESAQLDGVNTLQEFVHITIPMIFPTFITFVVVGIAGIFTNQMQLYTLFGSNSPSFSTFGYFLYVRTQSSKGLTTVASSLPSSYPELAALGLIMTAILVPITLVVRHLLEKYGPRTD